MSRHGSDAVGGSEIVAGKVSGHVRDRWTHAELLSFVAEMVKSYP